MSLVAVTACGGHHASRVNPADPFAEIPVGAIPVTSLSGSNVLLLTVGGLALGDSAHPLDALEARRTALLEEANAALDTAVRRDGREVTWMGLEEQRRVARRNPTLGIEPDRFATALLLDEKLERVPDPLFAQMRTVAAITSARFALVPAVVRISGAPGALRAEFVIVIVDARTGQPLLRVRALGRPAATAEAALAVAAGTVIATPVH